MILNCFTKKVFLLGRDGNGKGWLRALVTRLVRMPPIRLKVHINVLLYHICSLGIQTDRAQ